MTKLDYEPPCPPEPSKGKGMPVVLVGAGILLIFLGVQYLREWQLMRAASMATNDFDLWMGIIASALGVVFIAIAVVTWRRW